VSLTIKLLLELLVRLNDGLLEPIKLLIFSGSDMSYGLSLDLREGLNNGGKLIDFLLQLQVTMVYKTILNSHDFTSSKATRIVNIVTLFENQESFLALSCHGVLLNGSALYMHLHVPQEYL
jgi:hypothetical protein